MTILSSRRLIGGGIRSSVGREFAVLMLLVSAVAMALEPDFNPLLGGGLALGYLLNAGLQRRPPFQPAPPYRRSPAWLAWGALGGFLLGAALTLAVAAATTAVVGSAGLTWNTFVIGMLLGGSLIGIKYIWQNSVSRPA